MAIRLEFDQTTYRVGDTIRFQVVVEGEPVTVPREQTFTGTVGLPGQSPREVSGAATVVETATYGPFASGGYTVVQDETDPSRYTATPTTGG